MKNDNIHSVFSLFWLQILNLPASLQNKNTRIGPFPWKRSVLQNPDRERTNQSTGICLRLGLPYNKIDYNKYYHVLTSAHAMYWKNAVFRIPQDSTERQLVKTRPKLNGVSVSIIKCIGLRGNPYQ